MHDLEGIAYRGDLDGWGLECSDLRKALQPIVFCLGSRGEGNG